jgi:hypothetical protein
VALDGRYAVCGRNPSDRPAKGGLGGWVHLLNSAAHVLDRPPSYATTATTTTSLAPLERRDRVYRLLLGMAPPRSQHLRDLRARGYRPEEVQARAYGGLRLQGRAALCRRIRDQVSLAGVPGFFTKAGGDGEPYWTLTGSPGLLLPARSPGGLIRALRIRPDDPQGGGKYRWLSSDNKPGGTRSGAHCHVARPLGDLQDGATWITEGEIKSDLSAERLGAVVLSFPGVDLWPLALSDLAELLPGGGRVVVALDADWRDNPAVHAALHALLLACPALGYRVDVALWDPARKGLDDLLTAGLRPELHTLAAVPAPPWRLKWSSKVLTEPPARATAPAVPLTEMRARLAAAFTAAGLCPSFA